MLDFQKTSDFLLRRGKSIIILQIGNFNGIDYNLN